VKSGYTKKEQIHGGGAGKQEIHIGLRVGMSVKNVKETQQKEEL